MNRPTVGWNVVNIRAVGNVNLFDGQGVKNLGSGSPTDSVGEVVIADKEEDGKTISRQAVDAFGEFPLLSLARLTTLIGIASEKDKVYFVFQGIVYDLVKDF